MFFQRYLLNISLEGNWNKMNSVRFRIDIGCYNILIIYQLMLTNEGNFRYPDNTK